MVEAPSSHSPSAEELEFPPVREPAAPAKAPLVLILLAVTMFLPEEVSFYFGERRMTVARILLLLITPAIPFRFGQLITENKYRFVWSDVLVPVTGLWMFVGPIAIDGFEHAVVPSGIAALEFCVPYFAARVFLSERGQALALVKILCIAIATVGILAIFDTAGGSFWLKGVIGRLTGYGQEDFDLMDVSDLKRGFLWRATSTLEHPILLGTACIYGLLLVATLRAGLARGYAALGSLMGIVLAVSSAPLLGALIGCATMFYERITRGFPFRWTVAIVTVVSAFTALFVGHHDPVAFLIGHFTFDSSTAWYRVLQWDCAGGLVMQSPIFGIGFSNEWASICGLVNTIDSVWLRSAMTFGIPGSILIFLCYLAGSSIPVGILDTNSNLTRRERWLSFTLTIVSIIAIVIGITVFYWGTVYILTIFLVGIRAHLGAFGALPRDPLLDDDE